MSNNKFEIKSPYSHQVGDQIFGALYLNDRRVSDFGWWSGYTMAEALKEAIWAFNAELL